MPMLGQSFPQVLGSFQAADQAWAGRLEMKGSLKHERKSQPPAATMPNSSQYNGGQGLLHAGGYRGDP